MSKHHPHTKTNPGNRMGTSTSIEPEAPDHLQDDLQEMAPKQDKAARESSEGALTLEEIQIRAYRIHEEKGGSDLDNWLEAEKLLKKERRF